MNKSWKAFSVSVRRRETPLYDRLYRVGRRIRTFSFPCIRPIHSFLHAERAARTHLWHEFWRISYYEPMFKSQCVAVGPGFRMEYAGNGIALIQGDLQIYIGANVYIFDKTSFAGLKIFDKPELHIGDNTYISPETQFYVAKMVKIGNNCLIGCKFITDNPGHSINVVDRLKPGGGGPLRAEVKEVLIGDFVWLPLGTCVYPGTKIGDGVVALAGTHLNCEVPPFCLVAGQPGKVVRKLKIPSEIAQIVGKERYESYIAIHESLKIG